MKVCVSLATCPCSHIWVSRPCILCQLQLLPYLLFSLPAAIVRSQWVGVAGMWVARYAVGGCGGCVVCGKICSGCVCVATHTVNACMWCVVLELAVVIHGMTA